MNDTGGKDQLGRMIITQQQLQKRLPELGQQISRDYAGKRPLLIGVLKGAAVFMSDLIRHIDLPLELDFLAAASYGGATKSSGAVRIVKDVDADISGRDVILVEDIIDSGLTLAKLRETLLVRKPASFAVCSLLVREKLKAKKLDIRYVGFYIPDDFVVGYGLDANQQYRNLPDIWTYQS